MCVVFVGCTCTIESQAHGLVLLNYNTWVPAATGIAKSIKKRFPAAYKADLATEKGSRDKLGTYSHAAATCKNGHVVTVVNAYTQFNYRGRGVKADYEAIKAVFQDIKTHFAGKRIGYPMIGAGLAGGDWNTISAIIEEQLAGEDHTLVEYQP